MFCVYPLLIFVGCCSGSMSCCSILFDTLFSMFYFVLLLLLMLLRLISLYTITRLMGSAILLHIHVHITGCGKLVFPVVMTQTGRVVYTSSEWNFLLNIQQSHPNASLSLPCTILISTPPALSVSVSWMRTDGGRPSL